MTPEQRYQVLRRLQEGQTTEEIASELNLSKRSVGVMRGHSNRAFSPSPAIDQELRWVGALNDPARQGRVLGDIAWAAKSRLDELARLAVQAFPNRSDAEFASIGLKEEAIADARRQLEQMSKLGTAIRIRRAQLDISRRELATASQLSYPFISDLEKGKKAPSASVVSKLARALDCTLDELLALTEQRAPSLTATVGEGPDAATPLVEELETAEKGNNVGAVLEDAAETHAYRGNADLQSVVARVVRAELVTWAESELPQLVSAAVKRALSEEAASR